MIYDIRETDALILVDLLVDFCPKGKLAVNDGDKIMKPIVDLANRFKQNNAKIVAAQDWHPDDHFSFYENHDEAKPFDIITCDYGNQTLWPKHAVQGTKGADFHKDAIPAINLADIIIRKGSNPKVDSHSAFFENDHKTSTGLGAWLRSHRIKRCYFVGLAFDYCVAYSALDCMRENMDSVVIKDLTKSIKNVFQDGTNSEDDMINQFKLNHVKLINSNEMEGN